MSEQERQARALVKAHNRIDTLKQALDLITAVASHDQERIAELEAQLSALTREHLERGRRLDEVIRERDAAMTFSETCPRCLFSQARARAAEARK